MRSKIAFWLFCMGMIFSGFAVQLDIGTPQTFIGKVQNQRTRAGSILSLQTCCGGEVDLFVESYHFEDGYMLLSGTAAAEENSEFMIKGDEEEIYGWIHFKDNDLVYRYLTNDLKRVMVEQVPLSAIVAINETTPPPFFPKPPEIRYLREELPEVPHLGDLPSGIDVNNLQSRPESKYVIYLDITRVSSYSANDIWGMWQYNASGMSMFDVNVTTNRSVYNSTPVQKRGISTIYPPGNRSFCYVNGFGSSSGCNVYWQNDVRGTGLTGIHELGHLVAVLDAGHTSQGTYFNGLSAFKWVPIMGNYWSANYWEPNALYQWVKGEYSGANNAAKQDFFQYAQKNLNLLSDDITSEIPLIIDGDNVLMVNNFGRVGPNNDKDDFTFEVGNNAEVNITISPVEKLVMLDVHALILDNSGNVVVENNKSVARSATLTTTLQGGKYTLRVQGGAEGSPSNGFSTYGSVGYYGINGTITGASTDPYISISSPKKDDVFELGQGVSCNIKWSDNIDGDVKIELLKGGSTVQDIVASTASSGDFEWSIPADIVTSSDYQIIITSIENSDISDTSDNFSIKEEFIIKQFPYVEGFDELDTNDTKLPEGWIQESDDDLDWLVWAGPTPSKDGSVPNVTGPDGGYPSGTGNFIYVEASGENSPSKGAVILTPKFKLEDNCLLTFYCHMYSDSAHMGKLQVDAIVDGEEYNELVLLSKDSGDAWFKVEKDLSNYKGDRIRFRISGTTGESWASDICIDNIKVEQKDDVNQINNSLSNNSKLNIRRVGSNLQYEIPKHLKDSRINISLFNMNGCLVRSLVSGTAKTGKHCIDMELDKLSSGYYVCRISVDNSQLVLPIVNNR